MPIYTKKGDKGETSLVNNTRVSKNSPRVETYGTVDEANSCIGLAISLLAQSSHLPKNSPLKKILTDIQKTLFELGSELATPEDSKPFFKMKEGKVKNLEKIIDREEKNLPKLQNFILPSGTPAAASLFLARTIVRRAERCAVALAQAEKVNPNAIKFLNRLSDTLFVLARAANHEAGVPETKWQGAK